VSEAKSTIRSFDDFLKAAIKSYWDRGGRTTTLLALMFATRETWGVALDKTLDPALGKKVLTGAAGAAAAAVLIRAFLGGPLGLLLTGVSAASLVGVLVKNNERVWAKVSQLKVLINVYKDRFGEIDRDIARSGLRDDQRSLMIEGLMNRFLAELDEDPVPETHVEPRKSEFAQHVDAARRGEEERRVEDRGEGSARADRKDS